MSASKGIAVVDIQEWKFHKELLAERSVIFWRTSSSGFYLLPLTPVP